MADKILNTRIALKIDTLENWNQSTLPLRKGEVAIATVAASAGTSLTEPVVMIKIGEDGVKTFSQLEWNFHAKASDVLAACKSEAGLKAFVNNVIKDAGIATNEALTTLAGRVTTAESKITTLEGEMDAVEKKASDNEAAIAVLNGDASTAGSVAKAIADAIAELKLGDTYEVKGAAATAKAEVIGSSEDTAESNTIYGAKKYADGLNSAVDTRVQALETAIGEGGSVGSQIDAKINALDVTDTAVSGKYVSSVSEVDGKVVVTREDLPDYDNVYDAKGSAATVQGKLDEEVTRAKKAEEANAAAAKAADDKAVAAQGSVDALAGKVGTVPADKTVVQMIADAQTAATYDDTAVKADIKENADAIALLNNAADVEGSVDYKIAQAVAAIMENPDETMNSINELVTWINDHAKDALELSNKVTANADGIKDLEDLVGSTEVATQITNAIEAALKVDGVDKYALASNLSAAIGRITANEGEISTLKTKVGALEAVGAQANVIETVKVNGVELTPDANKAVDVIVPTGALASKDKVAEADLETALATKINAKAEQSALDELSTKVGNIPTTATATNVIAYVDEKVAAEGVSALKTRVDTAEGDIDKLETAVEKLSGTGAGSVAQALADAKAYTDALANGAVADNKTAIETLNGTGEGSVAKAVSDAIAALDVADAEVAHQVVTAVSETDGKIAVTRKQLTTDDIAVGTETWIFDCGGAGV